jgi:hypothetical protein
MANLWPGSAIAMGYRYLNYLNKKLQGQQKLISDMLGLSTLLK